MSNVPIRSWRAASRFCGVPLTTLRDAVDRGEVAGPVTGPDGRSEFDVTALEAFRARREQGVASTGSTTAPGPGNASTAMPSASAPSAIGALPAWMVAAADTRDAASERDVHVADHEVDDEEDGERREPFLGIPLGSTRTWTPSASWPYSAVAATTSTVSPRTAELEQQLADAIAQRDSWHRAARIKSLADTIAAEAMAASSGDVSAAQVAAYAAAHALNAMPLEQLSVDALAIPLARQAGHHAASAWVQELRHWSPPGHPGDEVARMRARRRSRSPRW